MWVMKEKAAPLLASVSVWGPLLVQLSPDGDRLTELFLPAPADCVWFADNQGKVWGRRLRPRRADAMAAGATTDLGSDAELPGFEDLHGFDPKAKPKRGRPFWPAAALFEWLSAPTDGIEESKVGAIGELEREIRHHVAIDPSTGTAADGALFGTEGVRMTRTRDDDGVKVFERLALMAGWTGTGELVQGVVAIGGERRTAFLATRGKQGRELIAPPKWLGSLRRNDRARVLLCTPAIFANGALPKSIAGARVITARVDRPEVVSGWDFAENAPKPTRRMAAAGSVYWVEVPDDVWAERVWCSNVSDNEQAQRDGFGLALVGVA